MKLTEEQYELIEAYLKNELSASDRTLLEADIRADTELRTEVDRQRGLRFGLRAIGIERAVQQARANYKATSTESARPSWQPTVVRPLSSWQYWAVAASTVVILGIGLYTYQQTTSERVDIAYADTMTDELTKGFPSDNISPEVRTEFMNALTNYKAGKYDQVIERLRTLPADKQTVYYKNYFLGLSYLANQQPTEAISFLNRALFTPSAVLRQKAEWCLALAYVKNGQKEKALPILKRVSANKAHPFKSLAQQVLQKIN